MLVTVPNMVLFSASSGARVSGAVTKSNGSDPDPVGRMLVTLLPGGHLDELTPETLMSVRGIQEVFRPSFTTHGSDSIPYDLLPVPPVAPASETYDAVLISINRGAGGRETITVLDWEEDVVFDPGDTDLYYAYSGSSQISGLVRDDMATPGNPILGALVMVTDASGNLVAFTETDQNGAYTIYNPPAGLNTVQASHPDWVGHQTVTFDISSPYPDSIAPLTLNHPQRSAVPGIDITSGSSGVITWTTNSDNPRTGLILEAKIIDYDGIAADGSSHVVEVIYPGGLITKTLDLQDVYADGISAYYDLYDGTFDIASYSGQPSVDFTFRVTDSAGNSSETVDNLEVAPVDPPDEDGKAGDDATPPVPGFSLALDPAQTIEAVFEQACSYHPDGTLDGCDYFTGGLAPDVWQGFPRWAWWEGDNVVMAHNDSLGRAPTWLNLAAPTADGGFSDLKTRVRIVSANSDGPVARIGGTYCRVADGDIFAMVGIKGDKAVYRVVKLRWEGPHYIVEQLDAGVLDPEDPPNGPDTVTHGESYDLRLKWHDTDSDSYPDTFTFTVVGVEDPGDRFTGSYAVSGILGAPDNPWQGIGIATWNRLEDPTSPEFDTTPVFDWSPVNGATYYRVRIYNLYNSTIYRGYTTAPPFRMPPGILKPNAIYKYRIEAIRDHQWFEWDNVGRSDRDLTVFVTGDTEAQAPAIDLSSSGVYTWTDPEPYGANTWFYVKVHDAQGVPDNIASVKVTMPDSDGTEVELYLDSTEGPTTGVYRGVYFGDITPGLYLFTVRDKDGHENLQPVPIEEDKENNENLDPIPIASPPENSLVPSSYDTVGDTQVTFSWDLVSDDGDDDGGAAFYQLNLYDKDFNYLFNVRTEFNGFTLPRGILKEGSLYKYRIFTRREFFEDNIDNGSTVPPFSAGNANDFITTPAYGSSAPVIDAASDGVAVYQAPSHVSDDPVYWLTFYLKVEDNDGVPANIQRVEVSFPHPDPDQTSSMVLKYNQFKRWNAATQSNELVANYYGQKIYRNRANIPAGTYTFSVTDFDGHPAAIFTDDLPNIVPNLLDWPENITPADGSVVDNTTPTIAWDPVEGAGYYRVRIMSAWNFPTVHWSGKLTDTQYAVPEQVLSGGELTNVLSPGTTYGLRVYAYQSSPDSEFDFYASNSSRHVANQRFTVAGPDSDGDGIPDVWEYLHFGDLSPSDATNSDSDGLNDLEEYLHGTNPLNPDSDGDSLDDDVEIYTEYTDPNNPDSDGDGRNDGREVDQDTDPNDGSDYSGIPEIDRAALIALYNSTNGDNWTNNAGWKTPPLAADGFALPGTECPPDPDSDSWYGISCTQDRVTGISLSNNLMTGSLQSQLANLTNLQVLNLSFNQLSGSMPAQLGNLANLQELRLRNNQLGGSIPPELGNLANLQDLRLQTNQLTGSIPSQIGGLAGLQYLHLANNQLQGSIPAEIGNLANLKVLELTNNQLTGSIPSQIGGLTNLQGLHLHFNQLSGVIPTQLGNLASLQDLRLNNNQLTGSIPAEIDNLNSLQYLLLSNNQLQGSIPAEIGDLDNLEVLELTSNQLAGSIPPELGGLTNLQVLNLHYNQLDGSIPTELGNLDNLQTLQLRNNQLEGSIPPQLGNLDNLQDLRLNHNKLEGNIPAKIGNLTGLQFLHLAGNRLEGSIPSEIGSLTNLQNLYLNGNQLGGSIPATLASLNNLGGFDIRYNALYTGNAALGDFLDSRQIGGDWESFQTVAPTDVTIAARTDTTAELSWTPIPYIYESGGYQVEYSTTFEGPYTLFATTPSKEDEGITVTGLASGTDYYFRLRTVTYPHNSNQNEVFSEYTSPDIDGDGVLNDEDSDPLDSNICRDLDADGCDDCAGGSDDPTNDGTDTDGDGQCDLGDPDDDNDGVPDGDDGDPLNVNICRDLDADGCDDCAGGSDDPANDGADSDGDGLCDLGDPDDDNDGVPDGDDGDPFDANICRDVDGDGCDDCTNGSDDPTNDGTDTDGDGQCDLGDPDDDNDGLTDAEEVAHNTSPTNPDSDGDTFSDGDEVHVHGTDPASAEDYPHVPGVMFVDVTKEDDAGSGRSWTYAKATIQAAIDAANPDDEIWVKGGIYYLTEQINVNEIVHIYGGFAGTESLQDQRDWQNHDTEINGGGVSRGFYITADATIDGFTITNGAGSGSGGGIYNDTSSPTITNCTFSGNTASGYGGGMYNNNSSPTVTNCTFVDNTADAGGGMSNYPRSSPTVTDCTFRNNNARAGGGMHNHVNSSPIVTNSIFTGNHAYHDNGGMINHSGSNAVLTNCVFIDNSAERTVGGIQNAYSHVTLTNCTFSGNTAGTDYGGMWERGNGDSTVTNCIFWGNTPGEITVDDSNPTITYSNVQGGWPGAGNIDADPLFLGPGPSGQLDFRLQYASPSKDAGDNTAVLSGPTEDFEGEQRIFNTVVDMGADEFVDLDGDQLPDSWERQEFGDLSIDGLSDADGDGLNYAQERLQYGTDDQNPDSDDDGVSDGDEVANGTDPNVPDPIDIQPDSIYYVDPDNGTDDAAHGDGSGSRAFKSLHFAVETLNGGPTGEYTLNLAPGIYTFIEGEQDTPLVLNQDMIIEGSGVILDGSGNHGDNPTPWTTGLILGPGAAHATLRGLTVQYFETGILINTDGGCLYLENVSVEQCDTGLKIVDTYQTTVDLAGSRIQGNDRVGVHLTAGSSSNVIRYGEVSGNSGDGIRVESGDEVPDGNRFEGIQILDNARNGIIFYDGRDNVVTGCLISGNNTDSNGYGGVAVLEGGAAINWNTIENNGCHGVYADDIHAAAPIDAAYN